MKIKVSELKARDLLIDEIIRLKRKKGRVDSWYYAGLTNLTLSQLAKERDSLEFTNGR